MWPWDQRELPFRPGCVPQLKVVVDGRLVVGPGRPSLCSDKIPDCPLPETGSLLSTACPDGWFDLFLRVPWLCRSKVVPTRVPHTCHPALLLCSHTSIKCFITPSIILDHNNTLQCSLVLSFTSSCCGVVLGVAQEKN